jgi:hypothetical protein
MVKPLRHRQTKEAATDMFDLKQLRHTSTLPWPCQNALPQKALDEAGCDSSCLFGFDYARIAAISGWMPMMFITRVRL